jgi:hypothetical protein
MVMTEPPELVTERPERGPRRVPDRFEISRRVYRLTADGAMNVPPQLP